MFLFLALFLRVEPRLFKLVVRDRGFHPVRDKLHALLHFGNFVGKHRLAELHARAGFVEQVNCLVRQEAVRDVPIREIHCVADGFFRIADRMKFFVAVADALQHANRFVFVRRRDFHSLEPPLERPVFFDRLAVFARRRRADALNFAAA